MVDHTEEHCFKCHLTCTSKKSNRGNQQFIIHLFWNRFCKFRKPVWSCGQFGNKMKEKPILIQNDNCNLFNGNLTVLEIFLSNYKLWILELFLKAHNKILLDLHVLLSTFATCQKTHLILWVLKHLWMIQITLPRTKGRKLQIRTILARKSLLSYQ